jgi:hypothetical protein
VKKTYAPPELTVWGSLVELTRADFNLDGFALRGGSVWTEELARTRKDHWERHHWVDPQTNL